MRRHVKEFVHPKLTCHTLAVTAVSMAYSKDLDAGATVFTPEQHCQTVRAGFININHKRMHHGMVDEHNPRILSWKCVQGVRYGFEGREGELRLRKRSYPGVNGKTRHHLIGDKIFSRLAKRIKSLRHVSAAN